MLKYYCNICDSEIEVGEVKTGKLDFSGVNPMNDLLILCPSCEYKFKGAKASIYNSYKTQYETLDEAYLTDLKNAILNNVNPEPIFEDNTEPLGSEE